jgi:DNA polymerase elongation subunit (family B)
MSMRPVALDIETIGQDWDSLAPSVQTYLLDRAKSEAKREGVPEKLGLHPGTGRIVAIAMWYPEEDRGNVLLEGNAASWSILEANVKIFRGQEKDLLSEFWGLVKENCRPIITFHGRFFDAPYLMLRSAILGVEPSRNLMPYRYSFEEHCDLAEVLSFWNGRVDGTLDFWCCQFGISSPKTETHGSDVAQLYKGGKLEDIGRYCLGDAKATGQLYLRLKPTIRLLERDTRGS